LDELLAQSDIISLHAPLTASTKNIMNAGAIAKMKTGSYLINAARGELVDETALIDALRTGKLAGAGLDVCGTEPDPNTASVRMQEVTVRYYGELAQMDTHVVCRSIVAGVLKPILTERVTLVNALETARERGLHVLESMSTRERSYTNLISVKLVTDQGEEWVEGTVLHQNHLHIVSLYGIDVDAPIGGGMLIIRNADTPGVIGRVGTILGDHEINIANFALGRSETSREAVGVVNVDSEVPSEVLEAIRGLPPVRRAHLVRV